MYVYIIQHGIHLVMVTKLAILEVCNTDHVWWYNRLWFFSKWRPTCQPAATIPSTSASIQWPICHPGFVGFEDSRGSVTDSHGYNIDSIDRPKHGFRMILGWEFFAILCQSNFMRGTTRSLHCRTSLVLKPLELPPPPRQIMKSLGRLGPAVGRGR